MHPWYKSDVPGIAPDCNMKLVPVYPGEEARYERRANKLPEGSVQITPEKQQLIGVEYGTVEYETVSSSVQAVARVALDETKIAKVHSKLEGWIDQVFVDFTGKQVQQGDPLLTIYSPEALATQQEYLLAIKAQHMMQDNPVHEMLGSTENLVAAARKRMELWDIGEEQIAEITASGVPLKNLTLTSPISGFVMERNAFAKAAHHAGDRALHGGGPLPGLGDGRRLRVRGGRGPHRHAGHADALLPARAHVPRAGELHPAAGGRGHAHAQGAHRIPQCGFRC